MALSKLKYFQLVGYQPHPKQQLFHDSPSRFRVPVCGRRFGKSHMASRDAGAELFLPKHRFWIIGPTYDLAEKEFRVIWDDLIIGQKLGLDKRIKKAYSKRSGEMWIEFPWQARIECRSADHPENLVGEKLHGAIMSEAAKHKADTWERFIRPALADARGWATFPTTPEGFNWLYNLWAYGQNADPVYKDYSSWQFPSWDNPYVYPGGRDDPEIKLIQATVLPAFFDQEIAALFNAFIGKIYDEFSEMLHVKNFGYNPRWPNYISFDWGFTNPLAAVEFQVDPWGRVWIWREHYKANQILEAHVAELKTRQQPDGYKIDLAFGDSADPGACVYVSTHMAPCLGDPRAKLGIEAKGTRESGWREGVDLVKSYLRPRQIGIADEYGTPYEEPWLFISRNCPNTIREFNNYRAPASVGRTARNVREAAQAYDDHALDAIRYGLMHVFKLGAVYHLSDVYDLAELQESNASFFAGDINGGSGGYFDTSQLSRF